MTAHGPAPGRVAWLSVPACAVLAVPFLTLINETSWHDARLAYGDWQAIFTSLGLTSLSMLLMIGLGLPLAYWLARSGSIWKRGVQCMVLVALLTPPLAMGILLVSAFGPYGSLGEGLARLGIALSNNVGAFVLAQVYGGLAYFVLSATSAFEGVPRTLEEAARSLGCTGWETFCRVTLPSARRALATGLAIAWGRVIGEFGIVMVFAYFPQGIPVKLFVNLQNDGVDAVYALVWLLLLVTLPFPLWCLSKFANNTRY
ncbi:molybdate ABC transporter permease subunit [Pseudomonas sp. NPDC088368]|jgi:molybdate/tungstate transport system permease protein|uniref:molybdate ABC transporter permease subunit n=1 Tax=Pseudomonas sp. NPDC088368 TaxID=3364453 RepID=UPI0038202BA3